MDQGFMSLGAIGAYNQQQSMQNALYSQLGVGQFGGIGNSFGQSYGSGTNESAGNLANYLAQYNSLMPQPQPLHRMSLPPTLPEKKLKGALAKLRAEIDSWHGDVLEWQAA